MRTIAQRSEAMISSMSPPWSKAAARRAPCGSAGSARRPRRSSRRFALTRTMDCCWPLERAARLPDRPCRWRRRCPRRAAGLGMPNQPLQRVAQTRSRKRGLSSLRRRRQIVAQNIGATASASANRAADSRRDHRCARGCVVGETSRRSTGPTRSGLIENSSEGGFLVESVAFARRELSSFSGSIVMDRCRPSRRPRSRPR